MKLDGEEILFQRVALSDTKLMQNIYRLRLQVYGHECGFINPADYPDGMERDDYEDQAVHFAITSQNGDMIGAMRLILPGKRPLPIEEHCPDVNLASALGPDSCCAEISRLVISKRIRRRRNDGLYYEPQVQDQQGIDAEGKAFRRRSRPMAFGLYREMYLESKRLGITHWCSLMEKSLWMLLRVHGFFFEPVGEEVDLFGPVRPYVSNIAAVEKEVADRFPQFYQWFTSDVSQEETLNQPFPF